jgi:hypothetical protein
MIDSLIETYLLLYLNNRTKVVRIVENAETKIPALAASKPLTSGLTGTKIELPGVTLG